MKRSGILNPQLAQVIASMGHTETLCIADSGLPIPPEVLRIDLALTAGVPGFLQTLEAVLRELQVERAVVAQELLDQNPALYAEIRRRVGDTPVDAVPHEEFKRLVRSARAVVRTGEQTPYANVLLQSGVTF
jgi:D-ribose pyranase